MHRFHEVSRNYSTSQPGLTKVLCLSRGLDPDSYRISVKLIFMLLVQMCHINSIRTFIVAAMQSDDFF